MPATIRRTTRTAITIATERRIETSATRLCPLCTASPLLDPSTIAVMARVSTRAIYRAIESGAVHFAAGARVAVCLTSALTLEEKE
jgi:hypothetical protein